MLSLSLPASPDMLSHTAYEESCAGGCLPRGRAKEEVALSHLHGCLRMLCRAAACSCAPHTWGGFTAAASFAKTLSLLGGKKSKFIRNSCWEQKQDLNLPLHGPTCPTLAASPCPTAIICRTGCSGSWLPWGKPGQCWGAATPNSSTAVPTAACHAGDWLPTPLQAGHSYVLQLGSP